MRVDRSTAGLSCQRGFALIDAMIAITIMSVGLIAALDLITASQQEFDLQRKATLAVLLAQSKLEELDSKKTLPSAGSGNFGTDFGSDADAIYSAFTYTISVAVPPNTGLSVAGTSDLSTISSKVDVDVTFKDGHGTSHTFRVTGIKTVRP